MTETDLVPVQTALSEDERKVESDFNIIRKGLQELIIKGTIALDEVGTLAQAGQEARMYEVYSKLMNSLSDASNKLMDLHTRKHALKAKQPVNKQVTHNNNLIVASTSDVLEMVKKKIMAQPMKEIKDDTQS